jgi:hypothetical protein
MLTHIVCWKYKDETSAETRREHRAKLRNLRNIIPEIIDLKVGEDVLHLPRSYDTGLVVTFKTLEDLDVYTNDPTHLEVAAMGREIAAHVVSVDFVQDENILLGE